MKRVGLIQSDCEHLTTSHWNTTWSLHQDEYFKIVSLFFPFSCVYCVRMEMIHSNAFFICHKIKMNTNAHDLLSAASVNEKKCWKTRRYGKSEEEKQFKWHDNIINDTVDRKRKIMDGTDMEQLISRIFFSIFFLFLMTTLFITMLTVHYAASLN